MIRNWTEHGSLIHWFYPYRNIDPTGLIHPLAFFLYHTKDGFYPQYEALFPALCGPLYRVFGFGGLTVIPVVSGLATLLVIYATARRLGLRSALAIFWAAGLGTPILVYSLVFWDHVVMFLITAAAMYLLLRALQDQSFRFAAWAGAVLGLGVFIHELMLAMYLALVLASLPLAWRRPGRRLVLGLMAGFIPLILLWVGTNWALYGSVGGPHLGANMGGNTNDHPFSLHALLDANFFADRAFGELTGGVGAGSTIVNAHTSLLLSSIFGYALIGYWVVSTFLSLTSRPASALSLIGPILSLSISVLALYLIFQSHWAHGLFLATPLLIPTLAAPWVAMPHRDQQGCLDEQAGLGGLPAVSLFYAWMSRAAWLFIFGSLLNPMNPGADWGSRYLLPILPVMVVLAAYALERQYLAARPVGRRVVLACIIVVVGISIYSQAEGLAVIHKNMVYNRAVNRRVLALNTQAVVFSSIALGPELAAVSPPQPQFMARTPQDWQILLKAFRLSRVRSFTFVGSGDDATVFSELAMASPDDLLLKGTSISYLTVGPGDEAESDMEFIGFVLRPDKQPSSINQ